MPTGRNNLSLCVIATFLILFGPVSGRAQTPTPTPTPVGSAFDLFGEVSRRWEQLIQPVARRQVVRRLQRLSNNLGDLANDKQDLAEALTPASIKEDRQNVFNRLGEFQSSLGRLRRNLTEFSSLLPAPYQERGNDMARDLFERFSEKGQSLKSVRNWLYGSASTNPDHITNELRSAAQQTLKMKVEVDRLISQITNSL